MERQLYGATESTHLSCSGRAPVRERRGPGWSDDVKVRHWNISTVTDAGYGMTKYEDELASELAALDVDVDRIRRPANPLWGNTVASWLSTYRAGDADLVHATFQTVAPAGLIHRPAPFVVTVHDLAPLVYPREQDDISTRLQWLFTPRALERADHLIAISAFTRRELVRLTDVPPERISVVHQGVDHDVYQPLDRARAREHFDLDPDVTYILVVSSGEVHKRIDDATRVLEAVRSEGRDVKLLRAGYGAELNDEHVVSTGWVPEADMPKLYSAADVYLHTSEYEGFGLPVLESMACGTPVVARAVASIPEIVGDVYDLVDADADANELADAIRTHLPAATEGPDEDAIARSRAFSWKRTARRTFDVYQEVLNRCTY